MTSVTRCRWAQHAKELDKAYHDNEWGVPVYDDRLLFEFLILEGAQAGLSWSTILHKRENYRKAFDHFNVQKIAKYQQEKVDELLKNPGIVRNRLKIAATVTNAQAFLKIQKEFGSFHDYVWQFTGGKPKINHWKAGNPIPGKTKESDTMSKDLLKKGFKFVGSTICYSFMQAVGMVNNHTVDCFRYKKIPGNLS